MDREKVIKGLELCEIGFGDRCYETECPYYGQECTEGLKSDILGLLKEQEAVEPKTMSSDYDTDTWWFVCGSCKKGVISPGDNFCRWCGRAVKWAES